MNDSRGTAGSPAVALQTPSGFSHAAIHALSGSMTALLADYFALYLKTKNFHWHMSGAHFRDYHRMLDDHGSEIFAVTDPLAERIRKIGGTTIRSIGHIGKLQRIMDNDAPFVTPLDMIAELREDNTALAVRLRETHALCDEHGDIASASLLENWIDEAEERAWFLYEMTRHTENAD
jgi:starvation-inducible DNA-binding protein